jgi:hypothetical protein
MIDVDWIVKVDMRLTYGWLRSTDARLRSIEKWLR